MKFCDNEACKHHLEVVEGACYISVEEKIPTFKLAEIKQIRNHIFLLDGKELRFCEECIVVAQAVFIQLSRIEGLREFMEYISERTRQKL
jgi:hypothetical protein